MIMLVVLTLYSPYTHPDTHPGLGVGLGLGQADFPTVGLGLGYDRVGMTGHMTR